VGKNLRPDAGFSPPPRFARTLPETGRDGCGNASQSKIYCPHVGIMPIGVEVQHGPKLPPL
jgi:hypothetical protein